MEHELKEDNTQFFEDYNKAVEPVFKKHGRQLVPMFRFGTQWIPANLLVQAYEESDESKADGSTDQGAEANESSGSTGEPDSKDT